MRVGDICEAVKGKLICGEDKVDVDIEYAFASDLMSDVLTIKSDSLLLITGLANLQTIRTAEMSDACCVLFVRNKTITDDMKQLAEESGIPLISCSITMFRAAGELYKAGLKPLF
ncbi:MAG TPA: hypothetical protein PKH02_09130 [Bacteroidales bacterium]|nr:hypothetical protein [Bacteroidales bacterium]